MKDIEGRVKEAQRLHAKWMTYKGIWNLLYCTTALAYYYVNKWPKKTKASKKDIVLPNKVNAVSDDSEQYTQTRLVNLCPHAIWINGKQYNSEWVVRVNKTKAKVADVIKWIPTYKTYYEKLDLQIPPKQYGVIYVVSAMTAWAYPDRNDIYTITTENPSPWVDIEWLMFNPFYK